MKASIEILLILLFGCFLISSCEDKCDAIQCLNNGVCNEGICDCPEGFTGDNCEINLLSVKRLLHFEELIDGGNYYKIEYTYNDQNNIKSRRVLDELDNVLGGHDFYFSDDTLFQDRWTDFETQQVVYRETVFPILNNRLQRDSYTFTTANGLEYNQSIVFVLDNNCGVSESSSATSFSSHEFLDENCSETASYFDASNNELRSLIRFTKDDKNSNCLNRWCHFYNHSVGNTINMEHADLDIDPSGNTARESGSYNSVFEYNENGYPTLETRTGYDGSVRKYQFTYY